MSNVVDTASFDASPNNLEAFWMPFTANRQFKDKPRLFVGAKDMHYTTHDGRKVLDGTAGLWCVNAGHGRKKITEAVSDQVARMDYAPAFQMGHPIAFKLASQLTTLLSGDFEHVFFTNSGSEAVDTALKIALAYHNVRGEASRARLIGRERGYHGVGFGGISVGGIVANRKMFGTMLAGVDHLSHTYNREQQAFTKGEPEWGAHLADDLDRLVALHDASTIAAVIVEPMSGSTGVLPPPKGYLQRLRAICDKHGILLIFDEVITGFGRLGAAFAAERYGVIPDMITFAKGVTSGTVPMAGVIVRKGIYDAFMRGPEHVIELFHGYTYSAHPLACAAGIATLDIYRDEKLFERAAALEGKWADAAMSLKGTPGVLDIRTLGLVAAIDLSSRPDAYGKRAYDSMERAFHEHGLMFRISGDTIALSPPLIITEDQIGEIFEKVGKVIRQVN
jgi:beta-alanine--pyruvate transaminase